MTAADLTPTDDRPPVDAPTEPDAETPPEAADFVPEFVPEEVSVEQVRGVLRVIGLGIHRAAGDNRFPEHWSFTTEELDTLAPPFTNIVNASPVLRRAVSRSDHAQVAMALLGWTMRNVELGQAIAEEEANLYTEAEPSEPSGPPPPVTPAPVVDLGPLYTPEEPTL